MADWPATLVAPPHMVITSASACSGGSSQLLTNTYVNVTAWPAAARIIYIPFVLEIPVIAYKMSWENGATVAGNVDVGIYDATKTRIVNLGATAQAGTSAVQVADIADTALAPGTYWMAMMCTLSTATVRNSGYSNRMMQSGGVQQEAGGTALPTSATFANPASAYLPFLAINLASTV